MSRTTAEIRGGIAETWAVGLGLIPLGLAFGLLMVQSGYAWWWTPIFSVIIYAGSMEFLAIGLISGGVGPFAAALTGLMVNFRHIFYGLTFPRHTIRSRAGRAYSTYALTDESYAIVSARPPGKISGARVLTIQLTCQLLWVIPGIIGAVAGQAVPDDVQGMEFALTALFVVLAWESFANNRDLSLPLAAAALAIGSALIAPAQMLIIALSLYFLLLLLRFRMPRLDEALTLRIGGSDRG
jgi:4-azaleucine resistance transporter AzlC